MADLSPKITNLRLARAERPDLRPDLRPESPESLERPERSILRPGRPDLRPERPDMGL